jgi:copper chaperone NosL
MAISQVKFASEIVTSDGEVYKFDEIGCMIRFKDQAELPERTKFYVKDFYSGEWIDAEEAIFVRSSDVATPMNSGIVAFKTRENLNRFFREYGGEVFSYSQIDIKIQR